MESIRLSAFLGTIASIDPSLIDPQHSQKELNAFHEDASLRFRRGYKKLRDPQTGFAALYGLQFAQGYSASDAEAEEYISYEDLGSGVLASSRNASTGAETAITGATGLHASDWTGFNFRQNHYAINPNHTTDAFRHAIGDTASWVGMAHPADPTTPLTFRVDFQSGGSLQYASLSWAGTDAGDVTVTGSASTSGIAVDASGVLSLRHAASGTQFSSFEIDLNAITAGIQNWTYNDLFAFGFTTPSSGVFRIDPATLKFTFTNNDGTPKVIVPTRVDITNPASNFHVARVYFGNKTRADWDNIKKVKVEYQVTASSGTISNNVLQILKPVVGCCQILSPDFPIERLPSANQYTFGQSFLVNATSLESGVAVPLDIPVTQLKGLSPYAGMEGLGCWITFTAAASAGADKTRYYWRDYNTQKWRRLTTQDDTTLTFTLQMDYQEMLAATEYDDGPFEVTPIVGGYAFKSWAVWLYGINQSNVRHSRIGDAEGQASDQDSSEDERRGANFTLADAFGDVPIGCGCQAGNSALTAGSWGVYEQSGDRPFEMSPPKKLPGSFGVANKFAFARFKDDYGNPGAAYVDKNGSGVYFALPSGVGDKEAEGRTLELTTNVGPRFREFLLDEQSALGISDFSTCRLFVDEVQDALWVVMGRRAMVLRRRTPAAKFRQWEFYAYNTGAQTATFKYAAASPKRRLRIMRSTGQFDELEWNSADAVWIEGISRDGGNPAPQGNWDSKTFGKNNGRLLRLELDRDIIYEVASVRVISTRKTQLYRFEKGSRTAKCLPTQQGHEHIFSVVLPESDQVIRGVNAYLSPLGRRWNL